MDGKVGGQLNFQVDITRSRFSPFSGLLHWIVLFLVWFEWFLPSVQVLKMMKLLSLTVKTEGMWIHKGSYRWFMHESVLDRKIMQDTYRVIR